MLALPLALPLQPLMIRLMEWFLTVPFVSTESKYTSELFESKQDSFKQDYKLNAPVDSPVEIRCPEFPLRLLGAQSNVMRLPCEANDIGSVTRDKENSFRSVDPLPPGAFETTASSVSHIPHPSHMDGLVMLFVVAWPSNNTQKRDDLRLTL